VLFAQSWRESAQAKALERVRELERDLAEARGRFARANDAAEDLQAALNEYR
jgi:hypothetical protein